MTDKVATWKRESARWKRVAADFSTYTTIPRYLLAFLEGFLRDTYGDSLREITDTIRASRNEGNNAPMMAYYMFLGETIEEIFRERLQIHREMSFREKNEMETARNDVLCYLLTGDMGEETESYLYNLNNEIKCIGQILAQEYATRLHVKEYEWIKTVLETDDIDAKQFVILFAIYTEPSYRTRFMPQDQSDIRKIVVKPSRFLHFVTAILPRQIRRLQNANYGGLFEFMKETRPMYMMIN